MKLHFSFQFVPRIKFEKSVNVNFVFITSKGCNSILAYDLQHSAIEADNELERKFNEMKRLIIGTTFLALIMAVSMPAISQAQQQLNSMGIPIEDPSKSAPKPQVQQPPKPQAQKPQLKPQNPPAQPQKPTVQAQKPPVQQPPKPQVQAQAQKPQAQPQLNSLGIPVENPTKP
jgi:outer membrane biosynthesis protein TonB